MARPTLDKKEVSFRMRMSDTEKNMLKELADKECLKMSEYIMMLIKQEYNKLGDINEKQSWRNKYKQSRFKNDNN